MRNDKKAQQRVAGSESKALWSTAYHEAGHAVVGWRLGIGLRKKGVTIAPKKGEYLGCCFAKAGVGRDIEWDASDRNSIRAEKKVQSLLAGVIAQRRYNPRSMRGNPASSDHQAAIDTLSHLAAEQREVEAWLKLLHIRTGNMLSNPDIWRAVERLASALMKRRTIPGKEVTEIIREGFHERLYADHPEMRRQDQELAARLKAIPAKELKARARAVARKSKARRWPMTHVRANRDFEEKMQIGRALLDKHDLQHWDFEVRDLYDAEHHNGKANLQQHIITIDVRMGRDFRQVVLHEIAHALRGMSLGHDREWLEIAWKVGCTERLLFGYAFDFVKRRNLTLEEIAGLVVGAVGLPPDTVEDFRLADQVLEEIRTQSPYADQIMAEIRTQSP